MSLPFTLMGIAFGAMSTVAGSKCGQAFDATPIKQRTRYKVYGVKGSFVNYGDLVGYKIRARVRYVSATPYASYQSDRDGFSDTFPGTNIVGPDGKTYTRCTLEEGGSRVVREMVSTGQTAGVGFIDVEYTFTSDGG